MLGFSIKENKHKSLSNLKGNIYILIQYIKKSMAGRLHGKKTYNIQATQADSV